MDRRSFLVGSGAVLTSAFVAKANWYIRNKNAVVPLDVTSVNTSKLYFVNQGSEYELRLGTPDFGFEELSYREVLDRYRSVYLPKDEKIALSEFRQGYDDWVKSLSNWIRLQIQAMISTNGAEAMLRKQKHSDIWSALIFSMMKIVKV